MTYTTRWHGATKVKRRRVNRGALTERLSEVRKTADEALDVMTDAIERENRRRQMARDSEAERGLTQRFGGEQS